MAIQLNPYLFGVLDIETSTLYSDNGEPVAVWLAYGVFKIYKLSDGAVVNVLRFREWEELRGKFEELDTKMNTRLAIYIHNLSFDGDYIFKNLSRPDKIISNSTHGIITATLIDFPKIELRCSFKLSMMSLRKIGEMLGFAKLESEYRFILPEDTITTDEWDYCERDCDVVARYLVEVIEPEFKQLRNFPLTKTGRVRKTFNRHYSESEDKPLWDITPPEDCYQALNDAFAGGIVIGNPVYCGRVITDVDSYDIKSSYPFVMLTEKYPYTIARIYNPNSEMLKERFWIAKIRFNRISSKFTWGWLSASKFNDVDSLSAEWYNGKLLSAGMCVRTITNIDFEMIMKTYDVDSYEVIEFYRLSNYDWLPSPYIETIKEFASAKHELSRELRKIDEESPLYLEKHIAYMLAKNDFNSIYGMSVQKLVQDEYEITDDFQYKEIHPDYVNENKHIKRNFLFGVFICAYARRNLLNAVLENCPNTLLYTDTDSIKYCSERSFKGTNKRMLKKYRKYPALRKLGIFEHDAHYDKFVYWGAKKYAYEKHGKVYTTVAGLPKNKGNELYYYRTDPNELEVLRKIEDFHPPMVFKDCKLGSKYIFLDHSFDSDNGFDVLNYKTNLGVQEYLDTHNIRTNGGVGLYKVSYSLDVTEIDKGVLKKWQKDLRNYLKIPTNRNMITHASCKSLLNIS